MKEISFAGGSAGKENILLEVLESSLKKINAEKILEYGCPAGMEELREEIAGMYGTTKDNVLITSGGQQALNIVFEYIAEEGQKILLQQPCFFGVIRTLKKIGAEVEVFEDNSKLEEILEKTDSKTVYLSSNFQNPNGECISDELKERIGKIAEEGGIRIIEDNPYDFIYYDNNERERIKGAIHLSGFSKILAPGVRVGYLLADEETIRELKKKKIDRDLFTSTLCQEICLNALKKKEYLGGLRDCYKKKRDGAVSALEEYFGDEIEYSRPEGGIFIQIGFPEKIKTEKLIEVAREKYNLILESDRHSYFDGKSRNTLRINFVRNSVADTEEGIKRFYQCMGEVCNED